MSKELTISKATLSNDIRVCMGNALRTAERIHVAMCNFNADHSSQSELCNAMHSTLIVVEQCRQMWERHFIKTPPARLVDEDDV